MPTLFQLQQLEFYSEGRHQKFRLMDNIRPKFTCSQLAIALKFNDSDIDNIMEKDYDRAYSLLSKWLHGVNQDKDKRPATWRTLIEALDCAGCKQDVKTLEEYFIYQEKLQGLCFSEINLFTVWATSKALLHPKLHCLYYC